MWKYQNEVYYRAPDLVDSLTPGYYAIGMDQNYQKFWYKKDMVSTGIIKFETGVSGEVMKEVDDFWNSREKYDKYGLVYKRGYIFWGPPGSGKSSIVRLIVDDCIARGGIAVDFTKANLFNDGITIFRASQKNTKLVVLFEDVEEIIAENKGDESAILNVLDGINQIDNVIFVATTNFPEKLGPRFINRPSRFDKRYFVGFPDAGIRKEYINKMLEKDSFDIDVDKWVEDTDGFTISHLKELFTTVNLLGNPYQFSLDCIRTMINETPDSADDMGERGGFGFFTGK